MKLGDPIPIRFSEPQEAWLREQSSALGIGVNELVRRIIDKERGAA